MIRVAILGYGNLGEYAVEAIQAAPDMELAGIIIRKAVTESNINGVPVVNDINELLQYGKIDVVLLCIPTRQVEVEAVKYLKMGINTVDSFDIHASILQLRNDLDKIAQENNVVSIVSAGWDPGSDSIIRAFLEAVTPRGITYTDFGPGMSMGHSVAAKSIEGVENALSMTIPLGASIHRRMVYVQLKQDADFVNVEKKLKNDPYFSHDETHVIKVDDINSILDKGSGVHISRKGVAGMTHNQLFDFNMKINNPALTTQVMVASARAALKQKPGAYTLIELPVIDLLFGDKNDIIKRLV